MSWNECLAARNIRPYNHEIPAYRIAHHTAVSTLPSNGNYQLVYTGCYICHATDYNSTTDPNHATSGFSTTCETCHTTTSWAGATFNHNTTKFPLTGAHTTLQCQLCHTNGNYQLVYTGCYACHTAEYNGTTNPNHAAQGFPITCDLCHSTANWTSATFDHSTTKFPLTGRTHNTSMSDVPYERELSACLHGCYACHTADYNGTTNPNHAAQASPQHATTVIRQQIGQVQHSITAQQNSRSRVRT